MHISAIRAEYPRFQGPDGTWRTHLWQIVVRIETDLGIVGYGYGGGGEASLPIINGHFRELISGEQLNEPNDITRIWDRLYFESIPYGRKGIAMMALSGVELALWDALGEANRAPVAELIGGVKKDAIDVYATGPDSNWYAELGVSGQKLSHRFNGDEASFDQAAEKAETARNIMGNDAKIMFDAYMSWDANATARIAERVREFKVYWFEDVLTPDDLAEMSRVRSDIHPILMAGGEHEFGVAAFDYAARIGAYDILQPDITWCGGITAGLRICETARQHGARVVPHRGGEPWGLHLIAASDGCDNLAELVMPHRNSNSEELWIGAPSVTDGKLSISDRPGFGVSLNESML